ncbi:hypothetical protein MLC59_07100 [Marinobacter bryozoorum]|uniref:hypothetical protein n=1 Tax=Marinobacter bryozoorum TaxID=256324 RepID=UPI0020052A97|nr:hypothetical protein [Marinobacter bryozoorum]MCK7543932.1 hypothetical protein [Marinobacter bryozoorum]
MRLVLTLIIMVAAIAVTAYAHWQLAHQVPASPRRWLGHGLIAFVAVTFGWAVTGVYMGAEEGGGIAAFLTAVGVAHLPPAIVLFLKQQQGR